MIAPKNEIPSAAMRERTIGELRRYISKSELAALTGLSPATIHRYKDAGQISFHQPGGKGARILFPVDAVEMAIGLAKGRSQTDAHCTDPLERASIETKLPGPRPRWLNPTNTKPQR
jgi:hypothetical protein